MLTPVIYTFVGVLYAMYAAQYFLRPAPQIVDTGLPYVRGVFNLFVAAMLFYYSNPTHRYKPEDYSALRKLAFSASIALFMMVGVDGAVALLKQSQDLVGVALGGS
jgi:hypothetical protein